MSGSTILRLYPLPEATIAVVDHPEMDHISTQKLRTEFQALLKDSSAPIVMDLSCVTYMPSLTMGALVEIATQLKNLKRPFVLAGLTDNVRGLFQATGIDNLFVISADTDAALVKIKPN